MKIQMSEKLIKDLRLNESSECHYSEGARAMWEQMQPILEPCMEVINLVTQTEGGRVTEPTCACANIREALEHVKDVLYHILGAEPLSCCINAANKDIVHGLADHYTDLLVKLQEDLEGK